MNRMLGIGIVAAVLAAGLPAGAQELKVSAADGVETVLAAQKGKRVTLRLRSGQETSGTVAAVTPKVVHIHSVVGKEFFDAVVPLEAIEAVFVRTKG